MVAKVWRLTAQKCFAAEASHQTALSCDDSNRPQSPYVKDPPHGDQRKK